MREQNDALIYQHPRPNATRVKHAKKLHSEQHAVTLNRKIAIFITKYFGSMQMFYVLVLWMFIWMALATFGVSLFQYDKYPFPFLLLCSNVIQLCSLPVLAVGQNYLSEKQEAHAEATYANTVESIKDEKLMIEHLEAQDKFAVEQRELLIQFSKDLAEQKEHLDQMLHYLSHELNDIKHIRKATTRRNVHAPDGD